MFNFINDQQFIDLMNKDEELKYAMDVFYKAVNKYKYTYNFNWLGRPIIQHPQDIIALQEIIWSIQPDLVVETGVAHGGSIIFYASILDLIGNDGIVAGIDIDIRKPNRAAIEAHKMSRHIVLFEGSSTSKEIITKVEEIAEGKNKILVILDSNHTHSHVLEELKLYSKYVSLNSYLIVFDTRIENLPPELFNDKSWGKGDNPMTAVKAFLQNNERFIVDKEIEKRLLITGAPNGFLKCIKD